MKENEVVGRNAKFVLLVIFGKTQIINSENDVSSELPLFDCV